MNKMRTMQVAIMALALGISSAPLQAQEPKRLQGFSVLLLLAETQGAVQPENISAPARKALADIKDFLPYKSFRVLDTVWVAGADHGNSSGGFRPDTGSYDFELRTFARVDGAKPGTPDAALGRAQFRLLPVRRPGDFPPVAVLDSSFNITTGETVVVGTSRLQADKALIVLLTAVAAGK